LSFLNLTLVGNEETCTSKSLSDFFYRCTVHFDICTVHSPTNALFYLKKTH